MGVRVKHGAGFRGGRGCVTERAGLAAPGATAFLLARTETTTSASATLPSPPTVDAASAHKKETKLLVAADNDTLSFC